MKNKKGFTLIELLAIIVILAIIAVITVPIILNIIENAKSGAVIDSAHGYKNGIEHFFVSKAVSDNNYDSISLSSTKTVSQLETAGLTVSGEKPDDGWVTINKGRVVAYSLKFGEYVVNFGSSSSNPVAKKDTVLTPSACNGCVYSYYNTSSIKNYGSDGTGTLLEDYESNYTDLELNSAQRNVFLGHILDGNGKIERGFVCAINDGIPFCIEGTKDGSKFSDNLYNIAYPLFGEYDDTTGYGCHIVSSSYVCKNENFTVTISDNGYVLIDDIAKKYNCSVNWNGNMLCFEHQ